jgi:predicted exporter
LFAAIALFGLTGLVPLRWSDGLRALYQVDPMLLAEDTRVRDLTGAVDQSRMVLARGRDLDEALERNQIVHEAVDRAKQRGELAGYRSVQPWLPAVSWQRENRQRLLEPGVAERFDSAFAAAGFRPGVFQAFFDDLAAAPAPLMLSDLRDTPLAPLVDPFVVELADGVVVVTWLRGDAPPSLRDELGNVPGVELFDQQAFLAGAYASYRVEMIRMLVLGLAAVLVIIFLRYRRWRPTAAAFLPALAGVLGVLGVVGWIEGTANLMHAASLLLVCSMGVDYGVFMVESRADGEHDAVTLAASILACATTVLSFGALGMSSNPGLASVGTSVAVGVLCALLTTPVIAALPGARVR